MSAFQSSCEHYEKGKPFSQGTPLVAREAGHVISVHLEHFSPEFALLALRASVVVFEWRPTPEEYRSVIECFPEDYEWRFRPITNRRDWRRPFVSLYSPIRWSRLRTV